MALALTLGLGEISSEETRAAALEAGTGANRTTIVVTLGTGPTINGVRGALVGSASSCHNRLENGGRKAEVSEDHIVPGLLKDHGGLMASLESHLYDLLCSAQGFRGGKLNIRGVARKCDRSEDQNESEGQE